MSALPPMKGEVPQRGGEVIFTEDTMSKNGMMDFLYGHAAGRALLNILLKAGLPKLMAAYLRSGLSRPMIGEYIKKYSIDLSEFEDVPYRSFSDFFIRKRKNPVFDAEPSHLISPCDGLVSSFPISSDSAFEIKNSLYRISDLLHDEKTAEKFIGGDCLIFRLRAQDYHRYCFIDSGFVHENRFFEGQLHSVQPIALLNYPVFRLNRRVSTLMDTDHFGLTAQIEVGAMAVGGMVNPYENCRVEKGQEMGRFELCGSTIVMLFEKGRIQLLPELKEKLSNGREVPVRYGEQIGE